MLGINPNAGGQPKSQMQTDYEAKNRWMSGQNTQPVTVAQAPRTTSVSFVQPRTMGGTNKPVAPPAPTKTTTSTASGSSYDFKGNIGDYYGYRDVKTGNWVPPKLNMPTDPAARQYLDDFRKNIFSYVFQPYASWTPS